MSHDPNEPDQEGAPPEDSPPEWDDRARPPPRRLEPRERRRRQTLPPEDPYWQFGMPVESWGSTAKREQPPRRRRRGPRGYLDCRACGVKVERKPRQSRHPRCPMCGRDMRIVTD